MLVCNNLLEVAKKNVIDPKQWFSLRIRLLLKSCIQSAEKLPSKDVYGLQNQLRRIINEYISQGYDDIVDVTLTIARINLKAYFICLKMYYGLKRKKCAYL